MELMRRAALERREAGRVPVKYVIVLTKTDKTGKKALKMTRDAVYKSVAELITSLPDKTESPLDADADTTTDTEAGVTYLVDRSPATADSGSNSNKGPDKSVIEEGDELTIIETSAFQRLGREALWEVILKGVLAP